MSAVDRAIQRLHGHVIDGDQIDWSRWLKPSDRARVVPIETLSAEGKKRLAVGAEPEFGLTLPWSKTDGRVMIRDGKVVVWSGFQHHGKSVACKQVMLHAVSRGYKVLIASMEEEPLDLWQDLVCLFAGTNQPTAKACDEFIAFAAGRMWIYDQQGEVNANRAIALIRMAASELGVNQAVIDSLMMLEMDRDDYDAQSRFMTHLKSAAKDTGCTVHLVAHMRKRDSKTGDSIIGNAHDIAGGHEIASKADYVLTVFRNKADDDNPDCAIAIQKQRGRKPYNWLGIIGLNAHDSGQFIEGAFPRRYGRV